MSDLRIVIAGAAGRMGRVLLRSVIEGEGMCLAGALEHAGSPHLGEDAGFLAGLSATGIRVTPDPDLSLEQADAVIDFTIPAATVRLAQAAAARGVVHVIGTTGLSPADLASLAEAGERTVVVRSGNMSLGVNLLAALTRRVAATLGVAFDIEILEMHHARKVDAPSGTALLLGEAAAQGRGIDLHTHATRVRDGHTGARTPGDIGFASLRGGTEVGEHQVIFAGPFERIELAHKAQDRSIFATGALTAARWGQGRAPGLYSMADVLDIAAI